MGDGSGFSTSVAGFFSDFLGGKGTVLFPLFTHLLLFFLLAGFADVMVAVFVVFIFAEVLDRFFLFAESTGFMVDEVKALYAFLSPALLECFDALFSTGAAFCAVAKGECGVFLEF